MTNLIISLFAPITFIMIHGGIDPKPLFWFALVMCWIAAYLWCRFVDWVGNDSYRKQAP